MAKASIATGPASLSKPPVPLAAEPAADRVPLACIRKSWTASLPLAATTANASPPISNAATPSGPASMSNSAVPFIAESAKRGAPPAPMRTSWTASSPCAATTAYVLPPAATVSMPLARPSESNPPAPSMA